MPKRSLLSALALCLGVLFLPWAAHAQISPDSSRDEHMKWWREARFGMFIHWGLYSVPAGTWKGKVDGWSSEWLLNRQKIPIAEYKALAPRFDPTGFNADAWVALAKSAGMKYIIITAKHHDGFAMFKSEADPFNIYDATPFKRDPLKELAQACQKYGIKLGFYYSQAQDWTYPGGAAYGGHWDKAQDGDFGEYMKKKALPQMEELLTNYQPYPAAIWFDTPTGDMTQERASMIVALLHQHPQIIWNNRLGGGFPGDTETPEQSIPPNGLPGRDWETCMTINNSWGYTSSDESWKSVSDLVHNLIDIASVGGNYLLNVGPDSKGIIPAPEVDRLHGVGQWLAVNGAAIYGTTASPFARKPDWGRVTQKPGILFLHVFNWPTDGKLRLPLATPVTRAFLLSARNQPLRVLAGPYGVDVLTPPTAPDRIASVIALDIAGPAQEVPPQPTGQSADGSLHLDAADAALVNSTDPKASATARIENNPADIGAWTDSHDSAQWKVRIARPGNFDVSIEYGLAPGGAPNNYTIAVGNQTMSAVTQPTTNWDDYKTVKIGSIRFARPGDMLVVVKPTDLKGPLMNLRSITFTPAH